ncbi:glycoside hydrolase family 38 C-terminal domain-containing protein [Chitinophaga barathri]|uniref:Glycosyl hydrolase n=1 Tax=Chitinophaga barathri TaxID=1647451 RepID=A0A3N4MBK7_9BACT|nr:glycoside hydrolase family 38 C-terminal domain-containing protein [Chitinophaga barathri]RPD41232.1 glycosyl hydrolase [Chitinophaga barathri]
MKLKCICLAVLLTVAAQGSFAQEHYFIDGYHGGVYGHYPVWYTQFMTSQLQSNPYWKINLEIEPETWDAVRVREPEAYAVFKKLFADQSDAGRIEYVNPAYGQSYLYTGSGESMIRQLSYGIQKVKEHFPGAVFTTYSSEEPCFTSALPQVLLSFGFKYASLKNPNTCWGGYTRAFGGELVQWQGPDGSQVLTVPRYSSEALLPNSTWQTTAWNNGREYIRSALAAGIKHPVGMCLQDAGWRNGPWLKQKARYETWRNYIGNVADKQNAEPWKLSQEDINVSLVWGAQVLQQIAQQVRSAENKLAAAEKYAAISALYDQRPWPRQALDTAWKSLLLAQHHDCWIVPYNGRKGDTWIDKVKRWTDMTLAVSDSILHQSGNGSEYVRVVNTTALDREEWVTLPYKKEGWLKVTDNKGKQVIVSRRADGTIHFKARVPAMGFSIYRLREAAGGPAAKSAAHLRNGRYRIETDLYQLEIDPARGGVITSLIAKKLGRKEMVDTKNARGFNELRGYFYNESAWRSSMDTAAAVRVTEDGKAGFTVEIKGFIAGHPFTQMISLTGEQRRIGMRVKIDWQGNPGIGAYSQADHYRAETYRKAFYNDSFKLQVLFPLNLPQQQLSKDAPYDVTESRLENTFFSSWDSIKNNVILHWADVRGGDKGMALFTDHTTSYVHGKNYPLGFTLQYIGRGLWGRNYDVTGPTEVNYAIVPHNNSWDEGGISEEETRWCEPLLVMPANGGKEFSLLTLQDKRLQVPAMLMDGNDLLIRIYNAAGDSREQEFSFNGKATQAILEQLNGQALRTLQTREAAGETVIRLSMPRFGIRTIRLKNVIVNH